MGLVVSTAVLNVAANVADATNSSLSMAASHIGSDGVSSTTGTITIRDAYGVSSAGNIRTETDDSASIAVSITDGTGTVSGITSQGSGVYTFTLTSDDEVGYGEVTATVGGVALGTATVDYNVDTASAADSTVDISAATVQAGNNNETVTITVKDDTGDVRTKARIDADAADEGISAVYDVVEVFLDGVSQGTATDNEDGTHTIVLSLTTAGADQVISAKVNGTTATDTENVTVTVAGADATQSQLAISATSISADSTSFTATVTLYDSFGNALTSGGDTVAYVSGADSTGTVVDNGDGTYTIPVTGSTTAGDYTFVASVNSTNIDDEEDYTIIPGAYSLTESYMVDSTINAVAGVPQTIQGIVEDAHGNRLLFSQGNDQVVTYDTNDANSTVTLGTVTLVNDGGFCKYNATISDTETETLTISMYINEPKAATVNDTSPGDAYGSTNIGANFAGSPTITNIQARNNAGSWIDHTSGVYSDGNGDDFNDLGEINTYLQSNTLVTYLTFSGINFANGSSVEVRFSEDNGSTWITSAALVLSR